MNTQTIVAAYRYFTEMQVLQQDVIRFSARRDLTQDEIHLAAAAADKMVGQAFGFTIRSLFN